MKHETPRAQRVLATTGATTLLAFLAACGPVPATAQAGPSSGTTKEKKSERPMTDTTLTADKASQDKAPAQKSASVVLPTPKVELPEVPYDKEQLPGIRRLDEMIKHSAQLSAALEIVQGRFEKLKLAASTSLNGTALDQVRGLMKIVDAFDGFEMDGAPLAKLARKAFMAHFAGDDEFSSKYREAYSKAEEELDSVIADHKTRRAVVSVMMNSYRQTPRTNLSYLESMLEESDQLRTKAVDRVIRGTETDMMVADYKKGRTLIDLLQSTRNKLAIVGKLEPKSERIAAILAKVEEKQASRQADVAEARDAYRFPERYSASNAPANHGELEKSMREALTEAGHKVAAIVIASEWIAVHSPLGIHLYNQIDFHVAVQSRIADEAKAGVLDVLYVTGKTGSPKLVVPFARRSAGTVAQMLEKNL